MAIITFRYVFETEKNDFDTMEVQHAKDSLLLSIIVQKTNTTRMKQSHPNITFNEVTLFAISSLYW